MHDLYVLHHSPWSERARWALLHHGIAFVEREHVPLIGELALRVRSRKKRGKVSVPLLVTEGGEAVQGSLAIAEWGEARGSGSKLFPEGKLHRIVALYDALEDALSAARERFVRDLPKSRAAQIESLPPMLRRLPFAPLSARLGTEFIARKYDARRGAVDDRIRAGLRVVRDALAAQAATEPYRAVPGSYILDEFSFADILAASIVQAIAPADDAYLPIPPATRKLWAHEKLAGEFEDLVAWRDELYAQHRPKAK